LQQKQKLAVLGADVSSHSLCICCDFSQGFKAVREFLHSGRDERVVALRAPDVRAAMDDDCPATPATVCLVRVTTPNGRVHVLMTSLLDVVAFPAAGIAELYHGRWRASRSRSSYKINRTLAIDKIKRQIGRWLLMASATTRRLNPLLDKIALNRQKFVPDRSRPRKPQPKPHLSHAYK
jgi:hypothetical protein